MEQDENNMKTFECLTQSLFVYLTVTRIVRYIVDYSHIQTGKVQGKPVKSIQ